MILVVGATGLVGGMIARGLLAKGRPVRALVRDGSDHRGLVEAGAAIVLGDLRNPSSLERAASEVDVIITTASAGQRGGADTPISVDLEGNQHLIEAAREAGVRQFIYISALTATVDGPVPLPRAKALTEVTLRESGLTFTILAANGIMDVMLPIPVVGPAAVTWLDIVDEYDRQLGHETPVRFVAPGELLPDLPPVPGLTELLSGLLAALESFDTPTDGGEAAATFGVTRTTLEAFVAGRLPELTRQPR